MDENIIGPVTIEFVINNPELLAQLDVTEAVTQQATENIERQAAAASQTVNNSMAASIERLKVNMAQYRQIADLTLDPTKLARYNQLVEQTAAEIQRLSNIGRAGFDEFGNAIEQSVQRAGAFENAISRVTDLGNIGARVVTQLSRQIIGLGVGMLSFAVGSKAIEALVEYIANLDIFTGRLNQLKQNMIALNEVQAEADKTAGSEVASLKLLYQAATDVTGSIEERTKAAQELKKEYPDAFANASTLAILNGQEKESYVQLTKAIVDNAKALAARQKIGELSAKLLDLDVKTDDVNYKKADYIRNAQRLQQRGVQNNDPQTQALFNERLRVAKQNADIANSEIQAERNIINGQIDALSSYAGGAAKVAAAISGGNKLIQDPLKNFDTILKNASDKADLDNLKKALQAKMDALAPNDAQITAYQDKIRQVDALEKQYSPKLNDGKAQENADAESLKRKIALLQEISNVNQAFNRKTLTDDEQAILAITAKYDQLRAKITAFNSDPKNKDHQISQGTIAGLQPEENADIDNQAIINENKYIQQDIEQKKKLYADYEAYKLKVGSDSANAEYADLLKSGKDFATYLTNIYQSADSLEKDYSGDNSGPIQQRKAMLQKQLDDNIEMQKKAFETLLLDSATYQEKRQAIEEAGADAVNKLVAAGDKDRADMVAQNTQQQLTTIDESHFKTLTSYKELFDGVAVLTRKQTEIDLKQLYASADQAFLNGSLTVEAYLKIIKQLNTASLSLKNSGTPEKLQEIGGAFSGIASEVSRTNETLGSLIATVGNGLTALRKVEELQNAIASSTTSAADKFKDEISLYTTAATSIVSLIGTITSAAAARKAAETAYYDSVIASQNAYNLTIDEQIRLQEQLNKNIFLKDYKTDIADASKALAAENKQFADSLIALQQGQAKTGTKNAVDGKSVLSGAGSGATAGAAIGAIVGGGVLSVPAAAAGAIIGGIGGAIAGLFGGKKKEDALGPLLGVYPDLIQKDAKGVDQFNEALAKNLIQNNLVSDSTKVLLQNTIDLNDARQAAIDQINQDITDLAGSLGDDLRSSLVNAFEAGTDAAQAFGDSVSKVIDNIVSQFLFQDIFGSEFDKLSDSLKASFSVTGDQNATDDLTSFFKDAGPLVQQYEAALKAAQTAGNANGLDLFASTTGQTSTLSGAIKPLTADQANILEGAIRGMQLAVVQTNTDIGQLGTTMQASLSELRQQTLTQLQIAANTKVSADNSLLMTASLNNIDKNTSGSYGVALRAAGKYGY